jgi:hypothetical protein
VTEEHDRPLDHSETSSPGREANRPWHHNPGIMVPAIAGIMGVLITASVTLYVNLHKNPTSLPQQSSSSSASTPTVSIAPPYAPTTMATIFRISGHGFPHDRKVRITIETVPPFVEDADVTNGNFSTEFSVAAGDAPAGSYTATVEGFDSGATATADFNIYEPATPTS